MLLRFIEPIKRRLEKFGREETHVDRVKKVWGVGRGEGGGNSLEIMIFFPSLNCYRWRISFSPNWGKIGRLGLSLIHIK